MIDLQEGSLTCSTIGSQSIRVFREIRVQHFQSLRALDTDYAEDMEKTILHHRHRETG